MTLSIATWNVNGIRARHLQLAAWIARDRPDVVCLQEIKAPPEKVPTLLCNLGDYHSAWHGAGGYSGVALHVRKDRFAEVTFSHPHFDFETRVLEATLGELVVTSVYVPNGGKDLDAKMRFLEALVAYAARIHAEGRQLILCGDLNVAHADIDLHPRERRAGVIGQRPDERALFDRLLGGHLVDVMRRLHPGAEDLFTWWAPWRNMRERNIGWRIDYVLASPSLAEHATSCRVLSEVGTSDHAPVIAQFS